jgi:hypothetical protein
MQTTKPTDLLLQWVEFLKTLSDGGRHLDIPSGLSAGHCYHLALDIEEFYSKHPNQGKTK